MKINKLIGISILTAGCLVSHSCNEEWDKWETIRLEATSSLENGTEVDYQPSSLRIDIKCNGEWSVEVPAWMSTDTPSGTGDAQVIVSIRENDTKKARTGSIRIQSGSLEPAGNIVGMASKSFKVTQQAKYGAIELVVLSANITRTKKSDAVYRYNGPITYEIRTELSNEEIAALITDPELRITAEGTYPPGYGIVEAGQPADWDFWIKNIDITKGQHTVTLDETLHEVYGRHTRADISIRYKVAGSGQLITGKTITSQFKIQQ